MIRFLFYSSLLLLFLPVRLDAQSTKVQRYTTKDGLPQSRITCVLGDSQGFVWAGTGSAGLARFDGLQFERFSVQNGLPDERIRTLFQDSNDRVWIGTETGLAYFDGQDINLIKDWQASVTQLCEGRNGVLWIATSRGLFYLEGTKIRYDPQLGAIPIYDLSPSSDGDLWIATDKGAYRYRKGTLSLFSTNRGASTTGARQLAVDKEGTLYIAYENGQLDLLKETLFQPLPFEFPPPTRILDLFPDTTGRLWLATSGRGLQLWEDKATTLSQLGPLNNKLFNNTFAIDTDLWGQYWVGTENGLLRYTQQSYTPFDQLKELNEQNILCLSPATTNQLWIGTSQGVAQLDSLSVEMHTVFPNLTPLALLQDRQDRLWIGTERRGLAMYDDRAFYLVGSEEELGSAQVRDIIQDGQGRIWVATSDAGISRLDPTPGDSTGSLFTFFNYRLDTQLSSSRVNQLILDNQQRIWYAGEEGIGYLQKDGTWLNFSTEDGLPDAAVRTLTVDQNGYLWGGTAGGGIFRCRLYAGYISVQRYTTDQGILSNNIYQLHFDRNGQLWVGHEQGVDRIRLDFYQVVQEVQHYGASEGFTGIETTANTVWENDRGQIFFGTKNGMMRFNPGTEQRNEIPSPLQLEQIQLFYQPLEKTEYAVPRRPSGELQTALELPYHQNHLSFTFRAVNQVAPQKVKYQYRLVGADQQWSPPTEQRQATYPNLTPGSYTLQVKSRNEDGVTSVQPLTVYFTIHPAIWQRWWFRWGLVLLAIGLTVWIYRRSIRQIRQKAALEKAQLEAEKQLLYLEQKALQLQMNPHFIFNALGSIQHLIGQQDNRTARYHLAKFSKLMRAILEHSRNESISLEDEIDLLENYLTLEQLARNHSFEFDFRLEDEMDPTAIRIPPMMIQPFLENAVVHGVVHRKDGWIHVNFKRKYNLLICTIEDNGIGRQKAAELKSQRAEQHKSVALTVTRERLAALSPKDQRLGFELQDRHEGGTRVVIRLPIL